MLLIWMLRFCSIRFGSHVLSFDQVEKVHLSHFPAFSNLEQLFEKRLLLQNTFH